MLFLIGISALLAMLFIGLCLIYWAISSRKTNSTASTDLQNNLAPSKQGSLGNLFSGFVSGGFWGGLAGFVLIALYFPPNHAHMGFEGLFWPIIPFFAGAVPGIFLGSMFGFVFGAKVRSRGAKVVFWVFVGLALVMFVLLWWFI